MPRFLRVIAAPRQVFSQPGRHGLFTLIAALLFEFGLIYPGALTTCLFRLAGAPGHAIWGLTAAFVNYAATMIFAVMLGGWMVYFASRAQKVRVEPWLATSALSYAWMPHVLLTTVGAVLIACGLRWPVFPQVRDVALTAGTPVWWARQALHWLPMAVWTGIAARSLLEQSPTPAAPLPPAEGGVRVFGRVFGVLLLAAPAATAAQVHAHWTDMQPVRLDSRMPHFQAAGIDRDDLDSDALAGRVVLLNFWATWCGPCVEEMPRLQNLYDTYRERGFELVALNIEFDNLPEVKAFVQSRGLTIPAYVDLGGQIQERFGVHTYPTSFLIDRHEVVRRVYLSPPDAKTLQADVESLLTN